MPCGGIYPVEVEGMTEACFYCNKPLGDAALEVIEWDAFIHYRCLRPFMGTAEGEVIREHQHPIITEVDDQSGAYVRLLCYAPELGFSDWALCQVDWAGDEEVIESWSRSEYVD